MTVVNKCKSCFVLRLINEDFHFILRLINWIHVKQCDHLLDVVRGSECVTVLVHVVHCPREVHDCFWHGQWLVLCWRDAMLHHVLPRVLDKLSDLLARVLQRCSMLLHVALNRRGIVVSSLLTLKYRKC